VGRPRSAACTELAAAERVFAREASGNVLNRLIDSFCATAPAKLSNEAMGRFVRRAVELADGAKTHGGALSQGIDGADQ
jgi:hypothetical protein